jgi:hypothetical protein
VDVATPELHETVETLSERIAVLVRERQALRADGADRVALERNRLEIMRAQQQLSAALIRRYRRPAA